MSADEPAPPAVETVPVPLRMTDLEEKLFGPGGAEHAKGLLARLDRLQTELEAEIRPGLPPDRYQGAQVTLNSLAAARDLLVKIYRLFERG